MDNNTNNTNTNNGINALMQLCLTCNIVKLLTEFVKDKDKASGYRKKCKMCWSGMVKKRNNKRKENGTKKCYECNVEKDVLMYSSDKGKSDGLQSRCKECIAEQRNKARENIKNIDIDNTVKKCIECNKDKNLNEYNISATGTRGFSNTCKECRSTTRKEMNYSRIEGVKSCSICKVEKNTSEFNNDKCSTDGLHSWCSTCSVDKTYKWSSTFDGFIKKIFKDLLWNAKSRNITVNITTNDIISLYNKQNGKCALTNK